MKNIFNHSQGECGIALIFSLTILSLLLFIGISFLTIGMSEKTNSIASLDDAQARMVAEAGASRAHLILMHDHLRNLHPTLGATTAGNSESTAKLGHTLSNPFVSYTISKSGNSANDIDACEAEYEDDGLYDLLNIEQYKEINYFKDGMQTPRWNYVVEPAPHGEPLSAGFKEENRNVIGRFAFVGLQRFVAPFTSVEPDEMRKKINSVIEPSKLARVGNSPAEIPGALEEFLKYIDDDLFSSADKTRLKQEFDRKTGGVYLDLTDNGANKIYQWPDMQAFTSVVKDIRGDEITTKDLIKFLPYITSFSSVGASNESFKLYNAPQELATNKEESDPKKRYASYQKFNVGRTSQAWSYKRSNTTERFWSGIPAAAYGDESNHGDYFAHRSAMWWAMDPKSKNNDLTLDQNKLAGSVHPGYASLLWKKEIDEWDDVRVNIPYISGMKITNEAKTDLGINKASDMRTQIMANIKDYCDQYVEDRNRPKATRVCDLSGSKIGAGVALGNETTPLINEIRFNMEVTHNITDPDNPKTIVGLKGIDVEFCKMYATSNISDYVSQFTYRIEVEFDNKKDVDPTESGNRKGSFVSASYWAIRDAIDIGDIPNNMGGYSMNSVPVVRSGQDIKSNITAVGSKENGPPKPTRIKLYYCNVQITPKGTSNENDACNFAYLPETSFTVKGSLDNEGDGFLIGFQMDDPRCSFRRSAWIVRDDNEDMEKFSNYSASTTGRGVREAGTWLKKNKNCTVGKPRSSIGWTNDPEVAAGEPWEVSTAFLRNASMRSLWELGFIHRIAPWQTINLKRYAPMNNDPENQFMRISDDGYNAGDARILDQVKLGRQTQTYGKINMSRATKESLTVLFAGMKFGSYPSLSTNRSLDVITQNRDGNTPNDEYLEGIFSDVNNKKNYYCYAVERGEEDPIEYRGAMLSKDQMESFTEEIIRLRTLTKSRYDTFTEALPEVLSEASRTVLGAKTDAHLEEAIGKTFPLIEENASYEYAVLVVGQSIRDVGKKGVFEGSHIDGIMGTQKMLYIFTFVPNEDPFKGKWVVTRKIYLND